MSAGTDLRLATTNDCRIEYSTTIGGVAYSISTRLVITPHFSYNENFLPQFRFSQDAYEQFSADFPDAAHFLETDSRIQFQNTQDRTSRLELLWIRLQFFKN